MYDFEIEEIAKIVHEDISSVKISEISVDTIHQSIKKYWADKVAVVWTTEDIDSVLFETDEDNGDKLLTDKQKFDALNIAFNSHDSETGLNNDCLRSSVKEVLLNHGFDFEKNCFKKT